MIIEDSTKWIDVETKQTATIYYKGSDINGKITPILKDSNGLVIGYLPSIDYNGFAGSFTWDGTVNIEKIHGNRNLRYNIVKYKSVNQANNPYTVTLILNNSNGTEIAISNEHKIFVGRPLILLHGGLSTSKEMETTETFKELSKNHYVIACEYLPPELRQEGMALFGDIKNYSSSLQQEVSEIIHETGAKKVNIVSHSMGGLVARWYLEKLGGTDNIGKLIMIGTPNHGLSLANLFIGSDNMAGSQMAPDSKFLKN
ncbi:MAG: alpha/beta fold hydrolase [Methanobacterium sp.]|nr:alpha/beta fold hydrolase [Methanobacterium sp.]